jgi:aminoglycoside phosphotransferase (APT) family kinase protein
MMSDDLEDAIPAAEFTGVDLAALRRWMDSQRLGEGELGRVRSLAGGTQNIMLRFERSGREYVLRRGPAHLRARTNDALRREMRVLDALARTVVPHPALVAGCPDETVLGGSVFYLMEPVVGFNATVELPALHAGTPEIRREMAFAMVDSLVSLGGLDYAAVGLSGLGRPDGFLDRQVPRWLAELESFCKLAGYPGPRLPGLSSIADWLERNRPRSWQPGLMHGDFHIANVMFRYDGPDVAAVVDWEMCTVGDPLLDLGWLVSMWPAEGQDGGQVGGKLAECGGLPAADRLIERYAAASGRDLTAVDWYITLACFKLGIILEGTYARSCAGLAPQDVGLRLHRWAHCLFERAAALTAAG